jgi:hypothetical protein
MKLNANNGEKTSDAAVAESLLPTSTLPLTPLSGIQGLLNEAKKYIANGEKNEALQILEYGITSLRASEAPQSAELMALWWDTVLWNAEGGVQELTTEDKELLYDIAAFTDGKPCFLLPQELHVEQLLWSIRIYSYKYVATYRPSKHKAELNKKYPMTVPTDEEGSIAIVPADTVRQFVGDLYGIWRENLAKEFYQEFSLEHFGTTNYKDYVKVYCYMDGWEVSELTDKDREYLQSFSEYANFRYIDDTYCYYAGSENEPETRNYYLQGYKYLGDDVFYIVFSDYGGDVQEPIDVHDGSMHLIVQRADTAFGFMVIAKPQDLFAEGNRSLIQPGWSKPALTLWE